MTASADMTIMMETASEGTGETAAESAVGTTAVPRWVVVVGRESLTVTTNCVVIST